MSLEVLYEDNHCLGGQQAGRVAVAGRRVGRGDARGPGQSVSQGAVRQAGERVRRAGPSARPADLRGRAPGQDQQGRWPARRAVPRRVHRQGLLGDRRGSPDRGRRDVDRSDREGPRRESVARRVALAEEGGKEAGVAFRVRRAVAESGQARAAAIDRTESSAPGAVGKPGVADPGRWEIWGEGPDRGRGRRESDRAACQRS